MVNFFHPHGLFGLCLLVVCLVNFSCSQQETNTEFIASIQPNLNTNIVSYEGLLQNIDKDNPAEGFKEMAKEHPHFSKLFVEELIGAQSESDLISEIELIQEDTAYRHLHDEVDKIIGDMTDIKPQIDQALENYLELFSLPIDQLPDIYTFISGFAYQTFVFDNGGKNGIGLSLEMFLGDDFPYQKIHPTNASFSNYLTRTYNKEHLVRKMAEVLVEDLMGPPKESNFLSFVLWGGKKLYMIDHILNFVPDTIVTEYTPEQLTWCQENEEQIWQFFFEKDLFFATDTRLFTKLIAPAPTSPGMPAESPGQTGNYIGWQIVKQFMSRYPNTTIRELITYQDAQQFLELSKYKPSR